MNALRNFIATTAKTAAFRPAIDGPKVPTLVESSPAYAAAEQRHADLIARQQKLQAERIELQKLCLVGDDRPSTNPSSERIAALAGIPQPAIQQGDQQRLAEVNQEIADIAEAIHLCDQARRAERMKASLLVCEAVADRHRSLLLDLASQLAATYEAWSKYDGLLGQLRRNQVAYGALRPQSVDFLGRGPEQPDNEIRQWLRDLVKAGFLERKDLPEGCR
jgi:hypothetical protein